MGGYTGDIISPPVPSSDPDLFSSCFEDAIGDNITEDTELEWDHSPDTNISAKSDESQGAADQSVYSELLDYSTDIPIGTLEDILKFVESDNSENKLDYRIILQGENPEEFGYDSETEDETFKGSPLSESPDLTQSLSCHTQQVFISEDEGEDCWQSGVQVTQIPESRTVVVLEETQPDTFKDVEEVEIADRVSYASSSLNSLPRAAMGDIFTSKPRSLSPLPPPPPDPPAQPQPDVNDMGQSKTKLSTVQEEESLPPPPPPPPLPPPQITDKIIMENNNVENKGDQINGRAKSEGPVLEHWPAPPLELEFAPTQPAVAQLEYKDLTSPTEQTKTIVLPPVKPHRNIENKSNSNSPEKQNVKTIVAPANVAPKTTGSVVVSETDVDSVARGHNSAFVPVTPAEKITDIDTCIEAPSSSSSTSTLNADADAPLQALPAHTGTSHNAGSASDLSFNGSVQSQNAVVVSIPIGAPGGTVTKQRHSFHPETAPKPVLSSFSTSRNSTAYSTLPRRSQSERIKRSGFDKVALDFVNQNQTQWVGMQEEHTTTATTTENHTNGIHSTDSKQATILSGNFSPLGLFANSPLLKKYPPPPPKRVFFKLPTIPKEAEEEEATLQTEIPPDENGVGEDDDEKQARQPSLAEAFNAYLLKKKWEAESKKQKEEETQKAAARPQSSITTTEASIIRPKVVHHNRPSTPTKRHTIAGHHVSPANNSPPGGTRATPEPTTPSSPGEGPPLLKLVRPPRLAQLMKQREAAAAAAASHKQRKRSDGSGAADSDDSYFSDSEFDDEEYSEVQHIDDDGTSQSSDFTSYSDETLPRSPADKDPCFEVVLEILRTERAYVDRLHFLCRVVLLNIRILNKVQDTFVIPGDALATMFNNIEDIYNLHTATILPKLEAQVEHWKAVPRFGDVMKEILPQLAVYTSYVEHFNNAMAAMTLWTERCPIFQRLIVEVEKTPECRRLKVKQHMLEVVQRIPKYLCLFKDYASHLPEHSDDKEATKYSLTQLTEFSQNLEKGMGKDTRMKQLCSVQQRLDAGSLKIYSPLRELVKESKIKSISPKTAKKLDRYVFLMNDVLLICTTPTLAGKHKLKFALQVDGLQVYEGDNLVIPFTFYVQNKTKAIEFHCSLDEEKKEWMATIQQTINQATEDKLIQQPVSRSSRTMKDEDIGKVKPQFVKPTDKPMCSICRASQKKPSFCKGCGAVVCSKCCSQKVRLEYDSKHKSKVCDECYILLIHRDLKSDISAIENVRPSDPCQIAGYLQVNISKSQSWKKRWLTIHDNGILYSFKNFKNQTVLGCLHLKKYTALATAKGDDIHKPTTLKLFNARRTYFLQADNGDAMERWLDSLLGFTNNGHHLK